MKRIVSILLVLVFVCQVHGKIDTSTRTFNYLVRTLDVRNPQNFNFPDIIRLGTSDVLDFNFDIIGDQHRYLRYKVIHCNADWQPSRLLESEYVEGFNEGIVDDYAYSENTYIRYVNYNIQLPNQEMQFLRSGNYLLQVYDENDPDDILLQARFAVSENRMVIDGGISSNTDRGFNTEYQQLTLSIDLGDLKNVNPYQDLVVTITQNNRPESMVMLNHPMRIEGRKAIFEHDPKLIFEAGNEYRRFETVRADYAGMNVDSVKYIAPNWDAFLKIDKERASKEYSFDRTQNGKFKINEYNSTDPDLGADYITVHFTLEAPEFIGADVFIQGELTNYLYDDSNKMKYDYDRHIYYADLPLKQGSYNYQYAVKPRNGQIANWAIIEGNKYETMNEYNISVFLRQPGSRGDELLGSAQFR